MTLAVIEALKTNRSLRNIRLNYGDGLSEEERSLVLEQKIYRPLEAALRINHFVHGDIGLYYEDSEVEMEIEGLLYWNSLGELFATIMKGYQFPMHFIKDLPDSGIPEAIAEIDKKAQLNGIFSFIRRKHDAVFAGLGDLIDSDKKISGKRNSGG